MLCNHYNNGPEHLLNWIKASNDDILVGGIRRQQNSKMLLSIYHKMYFNTGEHMLHSCLILHLVLSLGTSTAKMEESENN